MFAGRTVECSDRRASVADGWLLNIYRSLFRRAPLQYLHKCSQAAFCQAGLGSHNTKIRDLSQFCSVLGQNMRHPTWYQTSLSVRATFRRLGTGTHSGVKAVLSQIIAQLVDHCIQAKRPPRVLMSLRATPSIICELPPVFHLEPPPASSS